MDRRGGGRENSWTPGDLSDPAAAAAVNQSEN